jgi:hypothetical protein
MNNFYVRQKGVTTMPKKKRGQGEISPVLTKAEEFYIKGNREVVPADQIANDLGVPVSVVNDYIASLKPNRKQSRVSRLIQRPAPGVVAMTEAASMYMDDYVNKGVRITQAEVNRASEAGDYKLAAELAEQMQADKIRREEAEKARYSDRWHYIVPPSEIERDNDIHSRRVRR